MRPIDILMVADGERLSLGCMVAAIIARKSFPEARFHFAVPADAPFSLGLPEGTLEALEVQLVPFTPRDLQVEGKDYRILNKVRALAGCGSRPVLLCDSDLFFLRSIPESYLSGRTMPAATPEHGRHDFPWERLCAHFNLSSPSFHVLCGSGGASPPWFNAGLVYAPNAAALSAEWERICLAINALDWVPERWPYLDQIALPLAMASLSPGSRLTEAVVLDSRMNQNLFHWMQDQSYATNGFGVHHHGRVSLIKKYFPQLLMWLRDDYPLLDQLLERYDVYDERDSSSAPAPAQPALSDAPPQNPLRAFTAALERVFALELPQQAAVLEQLMAAKEQLLGKDISLATAEAVLRQEYPVEEPAWAAALQKLLLVFR